jgi:hypothetical protein
VPNFEKRARDLADKAFAGKQVNPENVEKWLDEKISKALDVYWSQLSLAMTQYTSPVYQSYLYDLLSNKNLESQIHMYLDKINALASSPGKGPIITKDDILLVFDELTLIRRPPYTRMAVISTPFRVFDSELSGVDSKLTGIVHELGHFMFWRLGDVYEMGEKQQEAVERIAAALKKRGHNDGSIRFIKAWTEELFADFVASKIGGDVFMESCEEMVIRKNKTYLTLSDNDDEHVSDILRPLISIYVFDRDQHPAQTEEQRRAKALDTWKKFVQDAFCTGTSERTIWDQPEHKQRRIRRSPDELSHVLLDTLDILFDEMQNQNGQSLFRPNLSVDSSAAQLEQKAQKILEKEQEKHKDTSDLQALMLDLFLNPVVLEAEYQPHSHTVKVVDSSSHHADSQFTIVH